MSEKKKTACGSGQMRSPFRIMLGLVGMVKPLLGYMLLAILMGCAGNLMATFLTVLGGCGLLHMAGIYNGLSWGLIVGLLVLFAVLRGVLRYAEQACNHYIAFKLLARIRHKVFAALRRLAPAKLEGSEKGNLISIITSDIELLEVFYAHTISPIAIAVLTSVFMIWFMGHMHPLLGITSACFYLLVGMAIPLLNGKLGRDSGQQYRDFFGTLNTTVLDNLYGLEEILQYQQAEKRMEDLQQRTKQLEHVNEKLKKGENMQRIMTDGVILAAGAVVAVLCAGLYGQHAIADYQCVIAVIAMVSSFGPTAALSSLSNNLHHTLASGNRVLDILQEEPVVEEIHDGSTQCGGEIACKDISFSYEGNNGEREVVLQHFQKSFAPNRIHGIWGKSGCGKSTLLKLLMRFYETEDGAIFYGNENVNEINTEALRRNISYVTQETFLFHDTIENNLRVANETATKEAVIEAAKKASIHDFIMSLPDGYDTQLSELGDCISGGEKQRMGIARAFLHDSKMLFLDEPTSNIDSLNEGIILQSLEKERKNKTIILVSHRKSTMGIADDVLLVEK